MSNNIHKHSAAHSKINARPRHGRVFDIMPPGKVPASASARPVIVNRKPQVQDREFLTPQPEGAPPLSKPIIMNHESLGVQPMPDAEASAIESAAAVAAAQLGHVALPKEQPMTAPELPSMPVESIDVPSQMQDQAEEVHVLLPAVATPDPVIDPAQTPPVAPAEQITHTVSDGAGSSDDVPENAPVNQSVVSVHKTGRSVTKILLMIVFVLLLAALGAVALGIQPITDLFEDVLQNILT